MMECSAAVCKRTCFVNLSIRHFQFSPHNKQRHRPASSRYEFYLSIIIILVTVNDFLRINDITRKNATTTYLFSNRTNFR